MYTTLPDGKPLFIINGGSEYVSSHMIIPSIIMQGIKDGRRYEDYFILYRILAKSYNIEGGLKDNGIPYKLYGGVGFFDKREIKDVMAYLGFLHDKEDNQNLLRIINIPARGIGQRTVNILKGTAAERACSIWDIIIDKVGSNQLPVSSQKGIKTFAQLIHNLKEQYDTATSVREILQDIVDQTGYLKELEKDKSPSGADRIDNIRELLNIADRYNGDHHVSVQQLLDEIALSGSYEEGSPDGKVKLMTIHSAKGLESPVVIIASAVNGILPLTRGGIFCSLEEERRLMYVAMTRAREELYIVYHNNYGTNGRSMFIDEIAPEFAVFINDRAIEINATTFRR